MRKQRLEMQFDPPVLKWLRAEAARRSVSIAEVVRQAVREHMEHRLATVLASKDP